MNEPSRRSCDGGMGAARSPAASSSLGRCPYGYANWCLEARANASAANLARMKKEAVGRDDKDVTDDVVGGVNIGAARNQRAADGRAAREAEEARYTQSAADLARMKKEAVGRDDKGRW